MFPIPRPSRLLVCLAVVLFGAVLAFAQQRPSREFPPGFVRRFEDLPPGRLRTQIERLPQQARDRAVAWLGNFHFTDLDLDSLQVDPAGGIFYADHFNLDPAGANAADEPVVAGAAVPVSPFPANLRFHSRPGAPNVLFINFSGESVSNTAWNTSLGRTVIPAVAFSTDGDYTTFSDAEQLAIKRIWQRTAEDYAPFNIDVTTERPAAFGTRTAHALITRNTDANGLDNPSATAGGVAYVNVFATSSYANYRPGWIYINNLANDESYIAEAASHEIGHNMGLSHDAKTDGSTYYGGHGSDDTSWGPLMGTGYNRNVSQWCKGEYYLANNTEDDLALIAAKIAYRADDHGNTLASATALTITGGTNVAATTPENDPGNTNSANKGVLERNTDMDVFSFATGSGTIDLTVNPSIMPLGTTRGGNLDVAVELYNTNGTRLLTNNSSSQTFARVQTNLAEGIYYLYVRNSGTGNPTSSTPSGYTAYGSIGQYFITGSVAAAGSLIIPPGATLQITDIAQPGVGAKQFTVTYSDNVAIDVTTMDGNDILVTGTNGYSRAAQLLSIDNAMNGTPRVATYSIDPPAGAFWTESDGGIYTVWMRTNQVSDTEGVAVPAGTLGQFNVSVPHGIYFANMDADPGWILESEWQYGPPMYPSGTGPTSGFTGTNIVGFNLSGNYPNRLSTAYATTPAINCSSASILTLRFRRWLGLRSGDTALIQVSTNGTVWTDVWSSTSTIADNSWEEVQYALPSWAAGSPSVRVRWGIDSNPAQNDIGWNIDDVQILSDENVDTTPPVAVISVANILSAGSTNHSFTVTYTDDSAVSVASLSSSHLLVTGPNGYSNLVDNIGVDMPADGTPRVASYSIPAPGGIWDAADNGTYQITIQNGQVTDTFNNSIAESVLGTFTVAITTSQQALVVSPTLLSVPEGSNSAFTIRLAEQPSANVTVTVTRLSGDADIIAQSGATNIFTSLNWSNPVPVVLAALPDPDQIDGTATFECRSDGLATVTVQATEQDTTPNNVPPLVAITSLTNGSVLLAPATFELEAAASDSDGTISQVEFFSGSISLGFDTSSPYSAAVNGLAAGSYTLSAVAMDNAGAKTTNSVSILVNSPPTASITSPTNGQSFIAPANITISASASDADGTISKVEFFSDATKLGEATISPYRFDWNSVPAGSYTLTVRATDALGAGTTSASVVITVANNVAPSAQIASPTNGTVFPAPASFTIAATASDSDGTISQMEFFDGSTSLGVDSSSPYSASVSNLAAGNYTLLAIATDDLGSTATNSVNFVVNALPTTSITSPANNASFIAPASVTINATAADPDGSVMSVEFFEGSNKLGEDTSSPFSFSWNNVPAGNYTLTVKATDNRGATTTSAPISVIVANNGSPVVILTSPTNETVLIAPAAFSVEATASDGDGTISQVEFFNGNTSLGMDTSSPYSISVSNLAAGNYTLSAIATDNLGATATNAVNIVVNTLPTVSITTPTNAATFTTPTSVTISVTATDTDGTVTNVSFFEGGTKIGEDTNSLCSFTWTNVPPGSYTVTVRAIDNLGATTISAPVNISVTNSPPQPVTINFPTFEGTTFRFTFETQAGRNYAVERGTGLPTTNWQTLTNIPGTGTNVSVQDSTTGAIQRFYRVLTE